MKLSFLLSAFIFLCAGFANAQIPKIQCSTNRVGLLYKGLDEYGKYVHVQSKNNPNGLTNMYGTVGSINFNVIFHNNSKGFINIYGTMGAERINITSHTNSKGNINIYGTVGDKNFNINSFTDRSGKRHTVVPVGDDSIEAMTTLIQIYTMPPTDNNTK
jgi:hypothetical protein